MCAANTALKNHWIIFSLNKMKTSDKFWFCCRVSLLCVFHKPEDIHINTDMVEWRNIWKWHGWKATAWQTFNSLVCGPLKASDLGWIIVANYFNYMLTQLPSTVEATVHISHLETSHTTHRKHFEWLSWPRSAKHTALPSPAFNSSLAFQFGG